jgi:hypothetical protein
MSNIQLHRISMEDKSDNALLFVLSADLIECGNYARLALGEWRTRQGILHDSLRRVESQAFE